jgi:hypothetical protein
MAAQISAEPVACPGEEDHEQGCPAGAGDAGPQTVPAALEVMTVAEFEPELWVRSAHTAARRGTISLEELAVLQVIHGPRRAQPGTYDAWLTAMQAVDPPFEFTDPPFRRSLGMTLALAAAGNRPAAVLTGPAIAARSQAWPIRRSRPADTYGMVRVSLQHHPLTASAALVWNGDLPMRATSPAGAMSPPPRPPSAKPAPSPLTCGASRYWTGPPASRLQNPR